MFKVANGLKWFKCFPFLSLPEIAHFQLWKPRWCLSPHGQLRLPYLSLSVGDRTSPLPPNPISTPHEEEASERWPRGRWAETKQALSHCCHHEQLKLTCGFGNVSTSQRLSSCKRVCDLQATGPSCPRRFCKWFANLYVGQAMSV